MLTRRGWLFLASAAAFLVTARLVAVVELAMLAVAALALPVLALGYVRLTRFDLDASRDVRPPRVHAGTSSRVELAVRNNAPGPSPLLSVHDPFEGGRRWARFLVAPLAPGETARAAYRLPTDHRGVFDLGPLQIRLSDPFGLATASVPAADATKLTVYPPVDSIAPLPHTRGHDPHAGADHPTGLSQQGEDFYALREYEVGDDLRRVHWPSTARRDELMIRQDEMPWQGRATVVLDVRSGVHNETSLEMAVSAAASVVSASWGRRSLIRLVATDGTDSGFAAGHAHVEAILEHLAGVQTSRQIPLGAALTALRRESAGGALAVVTTAAATDADLDAVGRLRGRYGAVVLVLFERSSYETSAAVRDGAPSRRVGGAGSVVRVSASRPFAAAWHEVVGVRTAVSTRW